MALFTKQAAYELVREGEDNILKISYEDIPKVPSVEDDETTMSKLIDLLVENPNTTKVIFLQNREYEYDYAQTKLLMEIASLFKKLVRNKDLFQYAEVASAGNKAEADRIYAEIQRMAFQILKSDPLGCYVELKRLERKEKITTGKTNDKLHEGYLEIISYLIEELENTKLVTIAKPHLAGLHVGDRSVYRKIFSPVLKPDFMFTKLMATYPKRATEIDTYGVGDTEVSVFELEEDIQYLYHVTPPEFKLSEEKYEILDMARKIMAEHKPSRQEFVDPERMREVFKNVGKDLVQELASYRNIKLSERELKDLTEILIRYTVGFGLIEILLADPKVQDITVNSPMGKIPIFIVHQDHGECKTNILPSISDAESWATKLRLISGRPLDEADPILDTEINLPGIANARVAVITEPLNPTGHAYAFRRHRDKPWTLALFVKNKMLTSMAAGLLSFIIDGNRTMLVAGTRSAGKNISFRRCSR